MKYTRYDMRKKKSDGTMILLVLAGMLIIAFVIGTIMSNLFLKGSFSSKKTSGAQKSVSQKPAASSTETNNITKFVVIQGGKYKNNDYIESCKNSLSNYGNPFTIAEPDGTRVLLGIYNEADSQKVISNLNEKKAANSKMVLEISNADLCNKEITEIIKGNLLLLTKLTEKNVKSIPTDDLKKWCAGLKDVEKDSKNYTILTDLKGYINNMPKDFVKEKAADNYVFLYNTIKKLNIK